MLNHILTGAKRLLKFAPIAAVMVAGAMISAPAEAQWHHRGYWGPRVGVYFGPSYYPGYYPGYYPPAYYAPPVVVAPPTYVEQGQYAAPAAQSGPGPSSMWYYCAGSRSYYPYVKDCAGGWQQVAPTPPQ